MLKLGLVNILNFMLSQDGEVWLRFWSKCLVKILKMKFYQDLRLNLWYDPIGYFRKMNSTLGSVVPLAMFFTQAPPVVPVTNMRYDLSCLSCLYSLSCMSLMKGKKGLINYSFWGGGWGLGQIWSGRETRGHQTCFLPKSGDVIFPQHLFCQ